MTPKHWIADEDRRWILQHLAGRHCEWCGRPAYIVQRLPDGREIAGCLSHQLRGSDAVEILATIDPCLVEAFQYAQAGAVVGAILR